MIITNKLTLDLQKPGTIPTIHAVQNDSYSRNLEITLYADRRPFVFPETGSVVIRYKKSDGKGGEYDTLPDGTFAWQAEQHVLTVALAPQVLTTPGSVLLSVTLLDGGTQLSIFPIRLAVEPIAAAKLAASENYFYLTGLLPAPISGEMGQCLRICGINDQGRITAVDAVSPENLLGDSINQAVSAALEDAKASGQFDGETPQKGVDYWTETEKAELIDEVLAALGTPIFGRVDEDNHIILTGALPDGIYTLKYEDGNGNLTEIGTLTHSSVEEPDYVNLADTASEDWLTGYRIKSDGITTVPSGLTYTTNYIPCETGDVLRVKGLNICWFKDSETSPLRVVRAHFYDENKTFVANIDVIQGSGCLSVEEEAYVEHTVGSYAYSNVAGDVSSIRYVRFCGILFDGYTADDVIITVNQEIV